MAAASSSIKRLKIGPGRSQHVIHEGRMWTVAVPAGKTGEESLADQTKLVLADLDQRLAAAGTDKTKILDALVFLADVNSLSEFDKEWVGDI
jgi:enamine deaminase RidA (YjgF/YER057c/UK114 family)